MIESISRVPEQLGVPKGIILIRHGQTAANATGELERNSTLTSLGIQQAQEAGIALCNEKPVIIVHTGLKRTRLTAEIIAKSAGFQDVPMISMEAFLEREMGIYDGKGALAKMLSHPGMQELYGQYGPSCVWFFDGNEGEGAEALSHMRDRIQQGIEFLYKHFGDATIFIIAHEGSLKMTEIIYEGIEEHMPLVLAQRRITNCEVRKFGER